MVEVVGLKLATHHPVLEPVFALSGPIALQGSSVSNGGSPILIVSRAYWRSVG
jgi:hypothetical protein